jgi:hypothetical protein
MKGIRRKVKKREGGKVGKTVRQRESECESESGEEGKKE